MTQLEYNIRTLIFHILIISGGVWLFYGSIKSAKSNFLRNASSVIAFVLLLALVFSLFASISFDKNVFVTGIVLDITQNGSWAGAMDSFSIRIEQPDGQTIWYHTSIFSSSSFKKSIQELRVGDEVIIYTGNYFNQFYRFEKIE